jgi:hypothetical protein
VRSPTSQLTSSFVSGQIAQHTVLIGRAGASGINRQLRNRVLAGPRQPCNGADADPFAKEAEDTSAVVSGKAVHGSDDMTLMLDCQA